MPIQQKITPFLWFDNAAEEAMAFYTSVFPRSRVVEVTRYGDAGPGPKGTVMVGTFELDGQRFIALNGGPHFEFTEAISLFIDCESQEEVDHYWSKLVEGGGRHSQCGWLTDRFGLSWQVVPRVLMEMQRDPDPAKSSRVMKAMLAMTKLDVATLRRAYEGR